MSSARAALFAAALAGVLALASASGGLLLAAGVAVVQMFFTLSGVRSAVSGSARPAAWLALVAGLGAVVWTQVNAAPSLTPMVAMLGPVMLIAIVIQLTRRDGRSGLTRDLSFTVTACVLSILPVAWVTLRATREGAYSVALSLLGVGLLSLAEALPISRSVRRVFGVVLAGAGAAGLAMLVGSVSEAVPAVSGVVLGTFSGVMAAIAFAVVDRVGDELGPERGPVPVMVPDDTATAVGSTPQQHSDPDEPVEPAGPLPGSAALLPLAVTLPFITAAPVAYVLGRILVG
ncbi:MAG TPA: hypothetical protein VFQ15_06800 [Jiangellaceae bacterium]|nr:hypothetical protein [Jiangellaceae bacterium]